MSKRLTNAAAKREGNTHRQVTLRVGDRQAEIDEGIVPLIREIWRAGIETTMSCQDTGGWIWVEFQDTDNAATFLNIVARREKGPDTLYSRMHPHLVNHGPIADWQYDVSVVDLGHPDYRSKNMPSDAPADFYFFASIRFRPDDLPAVLRRLREHNRANKVAARDSRQVNGNVR